MGARFALVNLADLLLGGGAPQNLSKSMNRFLYCESSPLIYEVLKILAARRDVVDHIVEHKVVTIG